MYFNILPGQHIIVTAKHPNPSIASSTFAALVVFVDKDRLVFNHPDAHNGVREIKRSGKRCDLDGRTVTELTGPDGKELLYTGFIRETVLMPE